MAYEKLAVALGIILGASPALAAQPDQAPMSGAPEASADAKYCLRVDPFTGSHIETIQCWTREQWADQGVDVDKQWAKDGVAVKG